MRPSRLRRWLGATLLLLCGTLPSRAAAQEPYTITGTVLDADSREPLPSVNVELRTGAQASAIRTITDPSGRFTLRARVPAGTYTVQFAQIGRGTVTRQVALGTAAAVAMEPVLLAGTVLQLDEVVVTGTGAPVERRQVGNTVASVSGEEVAQAPGAQTVDQALQGKIAGAQISENSGQPGGGVSIRLRGTSTIVGNAEPLIVIDGVLVENNSDALIGLGANATRGNAALTNRLADIDPADIERVEVIKGAAAAALYGSRANNGVIQIFTRRGTQGRPQINFRTEMQAVNTNRRLALNDVPIVGTADTIANRALGPRLGQEIERFDIQDDIYRTGLGNSSQLSVSGGSEGTSYYLSGNWSDEEGVVRSTDYARMGGRGRITQRLSEWLEVGASASYLRSRTNLVPEGEQTQGILTSIIFTPTFFNPAFNETTGQYPYNPILGANVFDILNNWIVRTDVTRFLGSVQATATPLNNLTISYLAGLDDGRQEDTYLQPRGALSAAFTGEIQNPIRQVRKFNSDLTVTHEAGLREGLGLTTTAGFRYSEDRVNTVRAAASELAPGQRTVVGAVQVASQSRSELNILGGFLQERLSIADRIFLTGGLNVEASSAFGEEERWQFYPRVSGSWVVHDQPGFETGPLGNVFSTLRTRLAYGETGAVPFNAYLNQVTYQNVNYGGRPGLRPNTQAPNPDIAPERQREWEGGFDAGLLNDRVSVEFTYYNKFTNRLILNVLLAPTSGFASQYRNIGSVSNKGVEVSLNSLNVQRRDFQWTSRVLFARNRSRVVELNQASDTLFFPGGGYPNAVIEGQPLGVFYGAVYPRDANGNIRHTGPNGVPRRLRTCVRPAGCPTNADSALVFRVLGDPNPDFTASLLNTFNVRGVEIGVLFDGRFGNEVVNFTRRSSDFFGSSPNAGLEARGDTIVGTFVRNSERNGLLEEYVEDGSFVKLREIALGYRFGGRVARTFGAGDMGLRLAARNLYTWTDYSGMDPEVNMFSAHTVARGLDFATTPIPRTFVLSLDFNF
ncbi:MAG TPA: SusC/RagA family TonB-linked outer membrane protein [Longimicrobium sp.]|nr:SusC/RagA family TonB-linked outer membrane protein [Longimicrobium sp.]